MLLLACVAIIAVVAVAVGALGARLVARQRAHVAADAAALAAATAGAGASDARRLAATNGAQLVSFVASGDTVTVVVEVHGERATARATSGP
jgi:hypothetical protein